MTTVYPSSDGYFQQDNAPCHKARIISDWFLEHDNEFTVLKWPPQSPDLNPIEHLWDVVEREIRIMDVQPTNLQQLRDAIMSIWTKLSEECFQYLVESVPRRIKAVLKAKGGPTRDNQCSSVRPCQHKCALALTGPGTMQSGAHQHVHLGLEAGHSLSVWAVSCLTWWSVIEELHRELCCRPFLFTLYTTDFQYKSESCHLQNFSDDDAVVGCIRGGGEGEYRALVDNFVEWSEQNHLRLNVNKTREMVIDFGRKKRMPSQPLRIRGEVVEEVKDYKYLGVVIDNILDWKSNTEAV
ncbi:Transposable element Tcb2 transposase [Merluccius polli]|uniref:Transposable element Tcb2 transposase n=1 Tax=Merluccius polli TaxID=89951 RepID=A0AA47MMM2_MERPO|nr:Transposable element Tcb2 transposase [Merluccius polli]